MSNKLKKVKCGILAFVSHKFVIIPLMFAIVFLCVAASLSSVNTFVVTQGDTVTVFNSSTDNCEDVLSEMGIVIDETKYVEMPEVAAHGIARINIYDKKKVNLTIAGAASTLYTEKAETLAELLRENEIALGEHDLISSPVETVVEDGMNVEITKVSIVTEEKVTDIPFSTEKRPSAAMTTGTSKTLQNGVNGSKKTVYKVELRNGKEFARTVVSEETTKAPVAKIVEYGTKPKNTSGVVTTWSGGKLKYKKKLSMTATAYTTERTSDKITATGKVARVGLVAVDPRVIPLGSRLYIVSADGKSWSYGTAVAADTGVRGNKIDLFYNTYNECISFGRRKATVYVLE